MERSLSPARLPRTRVFRKSLSVRWPAASSKKHPATRRFFFPQGVAPLDPSTASAQARSLSTNAGSRISYTTTCGAHSQRAWRASACALKLLKSCSTTSAEAWVEIVGVYQRHDFIDEMREAISRYEAWLSHILRRPSDVGSRARNAASLAVQSRNVMVHHRS